MVNKRPVNVSIFRSMFHRRDRLPIVDEGIPVSWEHLVESLIREAQQERNSFYGMDGSEEERNYPGLDYTSSHVRARLVRQPFHAKLFRAFDALGLSAIEINSVATWWGSLHDRNQYEKLLGCKVRDTTEDDIPTEDELYRRERAEEERRIGAARELAYALQQRPAMESTFKATESREFQQYMLARGIAPLTSYSTRRYSPTYHHP